MGGAAGEGAAKISSRSCGQARAHIRESEREQSSRALGARAWQPAHRRERVSVTVVHLARGSEPIEVALEGGEVGAVPGDALLELGYDALPKIISNYLPNYLH